jgi:hypothetical protein
MATNVIILVNPSVEVNNVSVGILPNSIVYDEGLGEQVVRVFSAGGGNVQTAFANNVETNLGMVKFSLIPTSYNVNLVRGWKTNGNNNVVTLSDNEFTRTFRQAALTNRYEVGISVDGQIDVEFTTLPAV